MKLVKMIGNENRLPTSEKGEDEEDDLKKVVKKVTDYNLHPTEKKEDKKVIKG